MRLLASVALALCLLAPLAEAAPARVGADFPAVPLLKPGQERVVEGNLTYSYDSPAANLTNVSIAAVSGPSWLTARIEPARAALPAVDPSGRSVLTVRLTLGVRPGTAALEQHTLQLRLDAEANPPLDAAQGTAALGVRVAFVGALRVAAVEESYAGKPGEPLNLGVRVVNEGNGPARFTIDARPGNATGLTVLAPGPLLVETRGLLSDRVVNVSALAQQPGSHDIVVRYTSTHAFDRTLLGPSGEVRVRLEVAATGLLPAPDPLLPLGLAALALAMLRRRLT